MEINKNCNIPYKDQIKILKRALWLFKYKYKRQRNGLCFYLNEYCYLTYPVHQSIYYKLSLFNYENAMNICPPFELHTLITDYKGYWWHWDNWRARKKFLKWMLKETKKLKQNTNE